MTPGINVAKRARIAHTVHQYHHDASHESYGLEAAEKMGVAPERVFKTLVASLDGRELVVAVIPVALKLSLKHLAKAAQGKKAAMANPDDVERATGYVLGGVSPLGQKKRLRTFIDKAAQQYATIYVSAGRRGLEIELAPDDLATLVQGGFTTLCQ